MGVNSAIGDPVTTKSGPSSSRESGSAKALTWRSALAGLAGVALLCAVTPHNDYHLRQTYIYGNHFPLGCLFIYIVLVVVFNTILRRIRRTWALEANELLVIWAMLITGSGLASSGLMRYLGPMPLAAFYYGSASNGWTTWTQYIPDWMVPSRDPASPVIKWFFEGTPQGYSVPWQPWVPVFITWGILFGLVVGLMLCISIIFRGQWVERERLSFPLVQIPIEMAREPEHGLLNRFLSNRLMWMGCLLAVLLHGMNGLHSYWVSVPGVSLKWDMSTAFMDKPWIGLGIGGVEVFLSVVGIMFLVPTEVSFSMWAFFVAFRLLRVLRVSMGMEAIDGVVPNHEAALGIGGFMVWGGWMVWSARDHLTSIWRNKPATSDSGSVEPIALRTAALGAAICFVGAVAWTVAAGAGVTLALLMWILIVLMMLVLTRIVAESGLLFVQSPFIPTDMLAAAPGAHMLSAQGLGPAMVTQTVIASDPREALMPSLMNALRLKSERRGRDIIVAVLLAVFVGYAVSFVAFLATSYRFGGVNLDSWACVRAPQVYYNQVNNLTLGSAAMKPGALTNMGLGAVVTTLLLFMRGSIFSCTLHPLGFMLAGTYAAQRIWFSVFIAWALKWLLLRYGGLGAFRFILPFFLGMVVGEGIIGGIWVIVGLVTGVGTPSFLPN